MKQKGQAILEAALMLPVLVFVALGMIDIQWALSDVGDMNYIVTESARCEALSALPCSGVNNGGTYAALLASNLHLNQNNFTVVSYGCNVLVGACTLTAVYNYKALGVWFPPIVITRTGTATIQPELLPKG